MNRLTSERVNGIKTGYWTSANKEDVVQRLGEYEDLGMDPAEIRKQIFKWRTPQTTPPDGERVLIVTENKKGQKNYVLGYWNSERHYWICGMNSNVVAWAYLPKA